MATRKTPRYLYGREDRPKTWQSLAQVLDEMNPRPKRSSGLYDRLVKIENTLKEKK